MNNLKIRAYLLAKRYGLEPFLFCCTLDHFSNRFLLTIILAYFAQFLHLLVSSLQLLRKE
jgi:hypothetical protein